MIKVKFFTLLRLIVKIREVQIEADNICVKDFLHLCEEKVKVKFIHKLLENGKLITGTIILINGKNIHHLDKEKTIIQDGDLVELFPPGGGG